MAERIIELRDISKSYGQVYALGGVNLSVDRGEVVGLIGDNGAGKSTLIKILSGVVRPTSGEILVRGKAVTGWSAGTGRVRRNRLVADVRGRRPPCSPAARRGPERAGG